MIKSKSMRIIEEKMGSVEPGSMRYQALQAAKNFKSSWIALGQILYSVYKDKLFKEWGYLTFEAYCKKEMGIQKQTASKLLNSYYFLEKDEPQFLRSMNTDEEISPGAIPAFEAVNALRLASKNKEFTEEDYQDFKKSVFEDGKEGKDIKRQIGLRLRSLREEEDPDKARAQRRDKTLRRFMATIRSLQKEATGSKFITDKTSRELDKLIELLESEIEAV